MSGDFKDPDIFSSPQKTDDGFKDAEIFAPAQTEAPVETQQAQKPKQTFGDYYKQRMTSGVRSLLKGFVTGGPAGLMTAGVGEANQTIGDAIDKVAYNAGGAVTDLTGSPELGWAANTLTQAAPSVLGGKGAQLVMSPAMKSMGERIMQMALKPPLEAHQKMFAPGVSRAQAAINTLLEKGVNPADFEALETRRAALAVARQAETAGSGATLSVKDVADYVPNAMEKFRFGPLADEAVDVLGKVQQKFVNHPEIGGATEIPIQLAEKLKQGYQAAIGNKYGAMTPNQSATEIETAGEKQLARALRELQAKAAPKTAESLAEESALINAKKLAQRRAEMSGNNQLAGMAWINPAMLPYWIAERSPMLGGLMARSLYSGRDVVPMLGGSVAGGYAMAPQAVAPGESPSLDLAALGALYSRYMGALSR